MCKVIVFAGTTEGRQIAEFLDKNMISAQICVATEYGEQLLPKGEHLKISHERMNEAQMEELIRENGMPLVIDATHPYAVEATENIKNACERAGASYLRVLRESRDKLSQNCTCTDNVEELPENCTCEDNVEELPGDCIYTDSIEDAVAYLSHTKGNILVTTGSKEAAKFTALANYQSRVFLRVLSLANVAEQCERLGFQGKHLICMQGPFSTELNIAMLRQWDCKYLVTKMSGHTGGFQEKLLAAQSCGCTLIVIGKPLQDEGMSVPACKRFLCEKFSLESRAEISLVGMGMGSEDNRTGEAARAIKEADLMIGARRMVEACALPGQDRFVEYDSSNIAEYIKLHPEYEKIAIVLSGDTGFFSGAKKLLDALDNEVKVICGISSLSYFMSRLQKTWEDTVITSAHGRSSNLIFLVKHHKQVFTLLGTSDGVRKLAKELMAFGLGDILLYIGERLSYGDEKIIKGRPEEFLTYEGEPLSVVYMENPAYEEFPETHGIRDEEFIRDKVPMTKEEIRTVSLSKLGLQKDSVCYDIGAGTGSVSIEMAMRAYQGRVYAIEQKPLAAELLKKNKYKFGAANLHIIEGTAPQAMEELEMPTHAFIGGSSGNMEAIMRLLLDKNPGVRMVINCIALETVSETLQCLKALPVKVVEIVQLCVSRSKTLGNYHMMMGENPIYIISCTGGEDS